MFAKTIGTESVISALMMGPSVREGSAVCFTDVVYADVMDWKNGFSSKRNAKYKRCNGVCGVITAGINYI